MRALRFAAPLVLTLGLVGCGSDEPVTMPDVTSEKLDVAYDRIQNAGFEDKDKVKIEGGGAFGVVMEGNWTVCDQDPAAGETIAGEPTLTVARSCDDGEDEGPEAEESSGTPSESSTGTPSPSETASELPAILTVRNTPDFAALLKLGDNCSSKVANFARKYSGQTVEFKGSIGAMAPHGTYDTRFDILVGPGDFDPDKVSGPSFQFRDKNVFDLNLTGKEIPEFVEIGQNYTFVAELGEFDPDTCLYQLTPIETKVR